MKRTLMFVFGFVLLASIVCKVAVAQCPGGNCATYNYGYSYGYSYGWNWWPWSWYGYQFNQPSQTKTCTGPNCNKCEGPACAKMRGEDESEGVPATADDPSAPPKSEENNEQTVDSVPVSAVVEDGVEQNTTPEEPTANPSLQPLPADETENEEPADTEAVELPICPFAARVIALINQNRALAGLPPLKVDINLVNGCQNHSQWMQSYGFQHASNGGRECIAMGVNTPESLVNMWMNSSGHRAIIMGWGTWIGIGSAGTYHTLRIR